MPDETPDQKGDTTPGGEEITPQITQKDIDKIKVDARTAAEAEVGRATKAAQTAAQQAEKAQTRLNKYIEQAREAEVEAKRDEPDALSVIRARHAKEELEDKLAAKDAELEETKQTIDSLKTSSQQSTKELNAREIAARFQVSDEDLVEFTDGSKEAMEKLAQKLTKGEAKVAETLKIDPGGGAGVSKSLESLLKVKLGKDATYQEIKEHEKELKSAFKALN